MPSFDFRAAGRAVFLLSSALCLSGCVAAIPLAQMAMTPTLGFGAQQCAVAAVTGATAQCDASPLSAMVNGVGQSMRAWTGGAEAGAAPAPR